MKRFAMVAMVCLGSVAGLWLAGCSQSAEESVPEKTAVSLKQPQDLSAEAAEILNRKCTVCHGAERFEQRDFTAAQWNEVIDRMLKQGVKLSGDELDVLRHVRD